MSEVKRPSRGGRRKRTPKANATREVEKVEEPSPETADEKSTEGEALGFASRGGTMPDETEVLATEATPQPDVNALDTRAEVSDEDAEESTERARPRDRDLGPDDDEDDYDRGEARAGASEQRDTRGREKESHYDDEDDLDEDDDRAPAPREEGRGNREQQSRGKGGGGGRSDFNRRDNRGGSSGSSGGGGDKSRVAPDEYQLQVRYDRQSRQFLGTVGEFPELKVTGSNREDVVEDLEMRVEDHLSMLRRDGRKVPEPVICKRYPERLEVRVSQNLQRRLDLASRQEKVGLDQLVTELLTQALDRKHEPAREQKQQPHGNRGGQQQQRHHQQGGRRAGRNFHETMDNRENFMEYVRNLEKGNFNKKR